MTTPRIIRVFPRKTKATPDDALAYFGPPDSRAEADEVHVSVTFTYDKAWAEYLAEQWRPVAPVKIGGVAYGDRGAEFVAGKYVKPGYTFSSRGCPRRCWFCSVWKRDPIPRLLPIVDGWNVLDDNLLACPRNHVEAVFAMLRRQNRRIEFTGGLEALSLQDYQVELLASLRPRPTMFFAFDPGDRFETLEHAARRLLDAGFTRASHAMRVYVLIGYPKDTFTAAERRLQQMLEIGFTPYAMLWRPETPSQMKYMPEESWRAFQRLWARPAIIHARESVPYARSPVARARVRAARAAQRDDARDRANLRPAHRPRKAETVYNGTHVVNTSGRPVGNSRAYALRRLREQRPDIHARILAGEISPHAGMIEAGYRKRAPPSRQATPIYDAGGARMKRKLRERKLPTLTLKPLDPSNSPSGATAPAGNEGPRTCADRSCAPDALPASRRLVTRFSSRYRGRAPAPGGRPRRER